MRATALCPFLLLTSRDAKPQVPSRPLSAQPREPPPPPGGSGCPSAGLSAALAMSWNGPFSLRISAPWQLEVSSWQTPLEELKPWDRGSIPLPVPTHEPVREASHSPASIAQLSVLGVLSRGPPSWCHGHEHRTCPAVKFTLFTCQHGLHLNFSKGNLAKRPQLPCFPELKPGPDLGTSSAGHWLPVGPQLQLCNSSVPPCPAAASVS